MVNRTARLAFVTLLLPLAGCLGPPIGTAQLVRLRTPVINVGPGKEGEVRAFRADATRKTRESRSAETTDLDEERVTLRELALGPDRRVPGQTKFAWNSQSLYLPLLPMVERTTIHRCCLYVYRPGYVTVEIPADYASSAAIHWQEAATLAAQVDAVDKLFGSLTSLAPGSTSKAHRSALLFAASEYERLAAAVPQGEPQRVSLTDKAGRLRELAAK